MTEAILRQIIDYAHRADPYPLYAELRRTPVYHDADGPFVLSRYYDIQSLLHDPRISSDARNLKTPATANPLAAEADEETALPPSFLRLDPPEHDRLRRMTNRPFGPPHSPRRVHEMRGELKDIVSG
ncbi:cytochrome P450, partial [Streptomyces mirabilis]